MDEREGMKCNPMNDNGIRGVEVNEQKGAKNFSDDTPAVPISALSDCSFFASLWKPIHNAS